MIINSFFLGGGGVFYMLDVGVGIDVVFSVMKFWHILSNVNLMRHVLCARSKSSIFRTN